VDNFRLDGKTALVTGGSRGIGFAISKALAEAGAKVIVLARNDPPKDAMTHLRSIRPDCLSYAFDLAEIDGIDAKIGEIEDQAGPIDILINNAGINLRGRADLVDLDTWRTVVNVNLSSPFAVSQAWAKRRIADGSEGSIVFIASILSEVARPTVSPYTAAKGGIRQLVKALAIDWAQFGIRVNGIGPGYIATDLNKPLIADEKFNSWVVDNTPLGRWGDPDDIGPAAVFLCSDAARFMTGQILYIDGGLLAAL